LLDYESVKNWYRGLGTARQAKNKPFSMKHFRPNLSNLGDYVALNHMTPDELLNEGKEDIWAAYTRTINFYDWLLKQKDADGKPLIKQGSACSYYSAVRGFYTHNGLTFPKGAKVPKREVSAVSKRDEKVEIYGYDEETDSMTFKNGLLQQFIDNLIFRDKTIALCLISTGADASDLLKLNVEFVKDGKGELSKVKRFIWHGNRYKDGEEFKVYFSEEATRFLKRYVEQERADAENSDPLFVTEEGKKIMRYLDEKPDASIEEVCRKFEYNMGTEKARKKSIKRVTNIIDSHGRLNAHVLGINFRTASRKMGYTEEGLSHPFRAKRFRHLFRTACGSAGIDPSFTKAFMGHASKTTDIYLEKNNGLFLREYVRVEPYITIFGTEKVALAKELGEVRDKQLDLYERLDELQQFKDLVLDFMVATGQAIAYYHSMVKQAEAGTNESEREAEILKLEDIRKRVEELKARRQSNES